MLKRQVLILSEIIFFFSLMLLHLDVQPSLCQSTEYMQSFYTCGPMPEQRRSDSYPYPKKNVILFGNWCYVYSLRETEFSALFSAEGGKK